MIDIINVQDLKNKLQNNPSSLLIDCREQNEWEEVNIPNSKLMPLSQFEELFKELKDTEQTIYIHCRSGQRSMKACQFLQDEGFENLYNVEGGILAWIAADFETRSK